MLVDIFITTSGRVDLFKESFLSFLSATPRELYRLTVVVDGKAVESDYGSLLFANADHILWHDKNLGLGPSINQALSHISSLNAYFDNAKSDFVCMLQDDVVYEKGWLEKLLKAYGAYSKVKKLGFASGHNAPEHTVKEEIKFGKDTLLLKPWIRATNMLAPTDYFLSMYPISRIDPETGRERARPHNGMGSSVDWWFIRNHPNSVCKTGRVNLVYPGLIKHIGFDKSTWLSRDLPEDK